MAKLTPRQKQTKALNLAKRPTGVTANEFASEVSVKTVGPMAMVLKRMVKDGHLQLDSEKRDGKDVFRADKTASLPRGKKKVKKVPAAKKTKKRAPSKKSKAPKRAASAKGKKPVAKKAAAKATAKKKPAATAVKKKPGRPVGSKGKKPGRPAAKRGPGRPPAKRKPGRPAGSKSKKTGAKKSAVKPLDLALKLGQNSSGFTIYDLAKARGTGQIGPFKRTVNKGVKTGVLKMIGKNKDGKDLYVAVTGAAAPVAPAKKKPGRKPKAAAPKASAASSIAALASGGNNAAVADLLEAVVRLLRA
jgi:hypothetical protein